MSVCLHEGRVSKRCDHATVRSRKIFQRLRKIWVFERKKAQFTTVLPFLGNLKKNYVGFWPILSAQNFLTEILVAPKSLLLESLHEGYFFSSPLGSWEYNGAHKTTLNLITSCWTIKPPKQRMIPVRKPWVRRVQWVL